MIFSNMHEAQAWARRKTVALVYIFESENANGYNHYDIWDGKIISGWLQAIDELGCIPYILDARTFAFKAANGSLPHIDFVLNLNNGATELSTLAMVPALASFLALPCIPANASAILLGENKRASDLIARQIGIQTPAHLASDSPNGVSRPLSLGSSRGVKIGALDHNCDHLYQEFISGFDVTTPCLRNPFSGELETLPSIAYIPHSKNPAWFLGEQEKEQRSAYSKIHVKLCDKVESQLIRLAETMDIQSFCRFDARVKTDSTLSLDVEKLPNPIEINDYYFLEINPLPTLKENTAFLNSFDLLSKDSLLHKSFTQFKDVFQSASDIAFVLLCAMASLSSS